MSKTSELRRALANGTSKHRGSVGPESVTAYTRLCWETIGFSDQSGHPLDEIRAQVSRRLDLVERVRNRDDREHEAWLAGGVHPLGTPERTAADHRRWQISAVRENRCKLLLAWVESVCERSGRMPTASVS